MDSLVLLGIWNVLPLEAWCWFSDDAILQLHKLTGRNLKVFTYVKADLHYECVLNQEVSHLERDLNTLSYQGQIKYVQKIAKDYYQEAKKLVFYLARLKKVKFSTQYNKQLIEHVKKSSKFWSRVTMQIWYAVFLDIWYPSLREKSSLKEVMGQARDHCGHIHEFSKKIELKLYYTIGKRLGIDLQEIYFLFPEEIIDFLKTGKSPKNVVKERRRLCVTTNVFGRYEIFEGAQAQRLIKKYDPPSAGQKKLSLLHGIVAQLGQAQGRVRVITHDKDMKDFKPGEVLVALQTMVRYVPVMKKASAILTEFGGLTSHAAIVSRELKKPCIVGIKNLVTSLKNGDRVEVDAAKGVVRKL